MSSNKINFHTEDLNFVLKDKTKISNWLIKLIQSQNMSLGEINYIFCSDDYLLKINQEHLDHDFYTDIITFDYCENKMISGDLFISIDRIKENAKTFNTTQKNELHRVIAHGLLHLLGYKDKSPEEINEMRKMEEFALNLRPL